MDIGKKTIMYYTFNVAVAIFIIVLLALGIYFGKQASSNISDSSLKSLLFWSAGKLYFIIAMVFAVLTPVLDAITLSLIDISNDSYNIKKELKKFLLKDKDDDKKQKDDKHQNIIKSNELDQIASPSNDNEPITLPLSLMNSSGDNLTINSTYLLFGKNKEVTTIYFDDIKDVIFTEAIPGKLGELKFILNDDTEYATHEFSFSFGALRNDTARKINIFFKNTLLQ